MAAEAPGSISITVEFTYILFSHLLFHLANTNEYDCWQWRSRNTILQRAQAQYQPPCSVKRWKPAEYRLSAAVSCRECHEGREEGIVHTGGQCVGVLLRFCGTVAF